MPCALRFDWTSALAPGVCGARRSRPTCAAPHPSLALTGQRRRVAPDLCVGRYEGTEMFLGRRARTDSSLHSSPRRREHLNTCVVQPRSVAPVHRNHVSTRDRLPTTPGTQSGKKKNTAHRGRLSLDKRGLIRVRLLSRWEKNLCMTASPLQT